MGLVKKYPVHYTVKDCEQWKGDWELIEGIPYVLASPTAEILVGGSKSHNVT